MLPPLLKNINENFYKWFEDSKSIDDTGRLIVFYHRSRSKDLFVNFDVNGKEKNPFNRCYGIYFVPHYQKDNISYIADGLEYYVFLKYKKPFIINDYSNGEIIDMLGKKYEFINTDETFCKEIQSLGYDAIIVYCLKNINEYIVFSNSQIKSIENNGMYSNDENIFE